MQTIRLRSAIVALFAAALAITSCSPSPNGNDGGVIDLRGRDVRFTLLHTADWHSRLFPFNQNVSATDAQLGLQQSKAPFGGAARMNWLIQRERAHADRLLHLDSGDCFQGAPIFNFFGGEAEVRALNQTGVDAVVIGNHEFDRGALNFARQFGRWATFPILAANYQFEDPTIAGSAEIARLARPYHLFNVRGLKVAVIGFGNLSSITSLFDQPNRPGITPLNSRETAQFYIDMVQAQGADLVVGLSHLGLEDDHRLVQQTTGFDIILGGHLHIVLNPPQEVRDCAAFDGNGNHFIPQLVSGVQSTETCDGATQCCSASGVCPPEPGRRIQHWRLAPGYCARPCSPRTVVLQHSGAFMKYLGRLDVVLSDDPDRIGPARLGTDEQPRGDLENACAGYPTGPNVPAYNPRDKFELAGHRFTLFPVDSSVPEEPAMARMLEPYARSLDTVANLDTLIGYSPTGISRTAVGGGDSPMGNLVATAMWRRLGVQTDLSITNSLGIRDSIPPGPVAIDQVFNVFPFENSITTMLVSGREVREMFDFVARRSTGRGCNSQAQIAGARVVITCGGCDRDGVPGEDTIETAPGVFSTFSACAETINIGLARTSIGTTPTGLPARCESDLDCYSASTPAQDRSLCEPVAHACMQPLSLNSSYALAANDFIAAGGSGFFVLQRNTTQVNTGVQLRDSVIDFVQAREPCGYNRAIAEEFRRLHPGQRERGEDGLKGCTFDPDCMDPDLVCTCQDRVAFNSQLMICEPAHACEGDAGRCVLRACADDLAAQLARNCPEVNTAADPTGHDRCVCASVSRAAETCRLLACFDDNIGATADGRLKMVSR